MYLIVIAWIYVVLMMSVAEATNSNGTVLGALITFVLYGLAPAALVAYLMGSPARNRAIKKRSADERARHLAASQSPAEPSSSPSNPPSVRPDPTEGGGHAPGGSEATADVIASPDRSIAPARKEP